MKKIKLGIGAVLMICAAFISDRAEVIAIYFLTAAIHEGGHLLAARFLKIPIKEIRFGFSGVRICTDEGLTSYKKEIILAFAGPFANLLSIVACAAVLNFLGVSFELVLDSTVDFLSHRVPQSMGAVGFFVLCSGIHCFSNLLPINTFDGGRIVYCGIADMISERAAHRVIITCTMLLSLILWIIALYLLLKVSSGLGVFVFAASVFFSTLGSREFE